MSASFCLGRRNRCSNNKVVGHPERRGAAFRDASPGTICSVRDVSRPNRFLCCGSLVRVAGP
jgi:hypothetical protein